MKKVVLFFAVATVVALASCGGNKSTDNAEVAAPVEEVVIVEEEVVAPIDSIEVVEEIIPVEEVTAE